MKIFVLSVLIVIVLTIPADATIYDYIIEDGYESITLNDYETLLMTGGGGYHFILNDYSQATIIGTSTLEQGYGGIWEINQGGYSILTFEGGEAHEIVISSYATAVLSGGRIDNIYSQQFAWIIQGEPSEWLPNPHITFVCDVDSVFHDTGTNILTGDWLDGSSFSIQVVDIDGYSPAIENIIFIPEPATLILLALGFTIIRRR